MLSHTYLYLVALFLKIRKISKISNIFCLFWIKILYDKAQIKKTVVLNCFKHNKDISEKKYLLILLISRNKNTRPEPILLLLIAVMVVALLPPPLSFWLLS